MKMHWSVCGAIRVKYSGLPLLLFMCLLLAGCIKLQGRCRLFVWNGSDESVSSVVVRGTNNTNYVFMDIQPNNSSALSKAKADIGPKVRLEVKTEGGTKFEQTVDLGRPIPKAFRGRILFQIEKDNTVKVFVLPKRKDSGDGELPWAVPPVWQGVPGIPGLSGRD